MIGEMLGILFDVALMLMLGVAIYFGVRLNRQMTVIRSGREQLEKLIGEFSTATERAEGALTELRAEVGGTLDKARQSAHKASELCDDLEFLIKRGEKVADALEKGARVGSRMAAGHQDDPTPERDGAQRAAYDKDAASVPSVRTKGSGVSRRSLAVTPDDQPIDSALGGAGKSGSAAKKARAKSKSELIKALQDMR